MKLILHADDFGFDEDTRKCTIELFEKGYLSSASIMANMPSSDSALEYAARHPEFSYGVHLTYVDGLVPLCNIDSIKSLVNEKGVFYESNDVRKKALLLRLKRSDIVKESIAQIKKIQDKGINISHLDSHGHLHKFPAFLLALDEICKQTGIHKIRRVQNLFLEKKGMSVGGILNSSFDFFIKKKFSTTDYFYMPANCMDTDWGGRFSNIISAISDDEVIEIGIHPGRREEWRKHELDDMIHFIKAMRGKKYDVINWNLL